MLYDRNICIQKIGFFICELIRTLSSCQEKPIDGGTTGTNFGQFRTS